MELSVKGKLWLIMGVMLGCIMIVGGVGYFTLSQEIANVRELIHRDLAFQDATDDLMIALLQHRRFEKDYFLNIGQPEIQQEYLQKFTNQMAISQEVVKKIAQLAPADPHLSATVRRQIADLEKNYQKYQEGFHAVVRQLQQDPRLTPQEANRLIGAYKEGIPLLEQDVQALMEAGNEMQALVTKEAIVQGERAKVVIVVIMVAAAVLAGVLGAWLSRSIYLAIFREGIRRLAGRL